MPPKLNCPVAKSCGGCRLIEQTTSAQQTQKIDYVAKALAEVLAPLPSTVFRGFHPTSAPSGYRNRIRLRITYEGEVAYFNENKATRCAVLLPSLQEKLNEFRGLAKALAPQLRAISHVEIRSPDLNGRASVFLTPHAGTGNDDPSCVLLVRELSKAFICDLAGPSRISQPYPIFGDVYNLVPLGGFMQVNFSVNEALVEAVIQGALDRSVKTCADLYCGSGNFLLPLLKAGIEGIGVELNEKSIHSAQQAAKEQSLGGQWVCADVPSWIDREEASLSQSLDMILLDPPRAGLKEGVEWFRNLAPQYIALCSCNPTTLGRDLIQLVNLGYRLDSVELFDMFEHTQHVETLAWLSLSDNS